MGLIADRMGNIDASGIRKVFALAASLENPINLSIGQPDFDVDEMVKDEAIAQIRAGYNKYTQSHGDEGLRAAVKQYYFRRFGASLDHVLITSGVSGGLFLGLMALVNPGDEVIFADPYFVMYKQLVSLLGGRCVPVDTYPDFRLRADAVEQAITEKSKVLLVNTPSNPTGVTLNRDELAALADVARRHDLFLISDEIYEQFHYEGKAESMAGLYDNALILNGFSKNAAMTGWRVGYAAGPEEVIHQMTTLQQYTFVCAPSFAQKAAIVALENDPVERIVAYKEKCRLLADNLSPRFQLTKPNGAFYAFPKAPWGDGDRFVEKAIENNVLIIPGSVFSERDSHFRISFAAANDTILRGVEVLNRLAEEG